jgi:hypothetical protein
VADVEPAAGPSFDDLCGTLHEMKPPLFDDRAEIAGELLVMHHRVIATLAGPISEALFTVGPMLENVDTDNARGLAEIIVRSPTAADAYLGFAAAEARGLLLDHRDIVVTLAEALMRRRTLTGTEVDQIASSASPREAAEGQLPAGVGLSPIRRKLDPGAQRGPAVSALKSGGSRRYP